MADQKLRLLVNTDLRPAYYDDFHCLAAGCRYSCCKGWRITFHKKDYLSLKRQEGSPELNARMERALRRIRTENPGKHYGEFDMRTGVCPLLREDCLCALQAEKGHEALPMVCQSFPRGEFYSSGYLERSLSPACEGVLELLWNLPEGVEFRSDPLPRNKWKESRFSDETQSLAACFPTIREWCVDMLQDRRFSLPDRLTLMGIGLRQLAEGERDLPSWLRRVRELPENTEAILPREPERRAMQEFLSNNVGVLVAVRASGVDFAGIREEITQALGAKLSYENGNLEADLSLAPYREAAKRYEERFGDREYFLENLMVTLLFHLTMPDPSSPETLWKSYANLCSLYSFYRFMAVMSCREGASGDKEELFRLTVFASRGLIHNRIVQNRLRDELFQNNSATLAHMAILLCG